MNSIERDIAGATAAHAALRGQISGLDDVTAHQPSRLSGWTVGHVLTHIARNADSHARILQAAQRGEVTEQYEGGAATRTADIEAGARRSAAELIDDVTASATNLEDVWADTSPVGWAGHGIMPNSSEVATNDLPYRRWREALVHLHDLGLAYSFADWPADYVRLELGRMTSLWASRLPMGLTTLPPAAMAVDDRTRLAWLLGRTNIDGLGASTLMN